MNIAVVGLGKMGAQIATRLLDTEHTVIAIDPNADAVEKMVASGALSAQNRADAVGLFGSEQVIVWLMIPAAFVSDEVAAWLDVLPPGSILIDGGNTDFRATKQHTQRCQEKNVQFIDVGVSGGILGTTNGFSMMVGGDEASYKTIQPVLGALAQPRGGYDYFGEAGSGHYVKMVHNAIEYGMMESLAEGYRMLKEGPYAHLDLSKAGAVWQKSSVIQSTLNELASEIVAQDQELTKVTGYVAESGEARWTTEVAKERSIELPAIQAALDVRVRSTTGTVNYTTKLLAALRNKFGGHDINKTEHGNE